MSTTRVASMPPLLLQHDPAAQIGTCSMHPQGVLIELFEHARFTIEMALRVFGPNGFIILECESGPFGTDHTSVVRKLVVPLK